MSIANINVAVEATICETAGDSPTRQFGVDNVRSWLAVVAGFVACGLTFGLANLTGLFYVPLSETFVELHPHDITMMVGFTPVILMLSGWLLCPWFDKNYIRRIFCYVQ